MQFIVQLFYRYKDSTWELMKILNTCLLYKFIHRKARMVEEGEGSLWIIFIDKRKETWNFIKSDLSQDKLHLDV